MHQVTHPLFSIDDTERSAAYTAMSDSELEAV